MDPAMITPFISSIQNVFSTMLQLPVGIGEPGLKSESGTSCDVSGIIGMSGDVVGSVVLSFPMESAQRIVSLFTGSTLSPESHDFFDAIGELVNMVSGGAKAQFPGNRKVSISTPSVVIGKGHKVSNRSDVPCIVIPCSTDCGPLVIEISIQERTPGKGDLTTAAAVAR
jgi:chemotaxis protein CheX